MKNETNVNELTKYYTQRHLTFSNKWLWQKDNGTIHATLLQLSWFSHIQVFGPKVGGNINQLRNKYVDIFCFKKIMKTWHTYVSSRNIYWWCYTSSETSDKHYKLNLTYKDKSGTFIGEHPFYTGNKPVLTLKEVDFESVKH